MHWSRKDESALVNALAMDITSIVEQALDSGALSREELRQALDVSNGRISQILSAPGNLTLRTMVRLAKVCKKDITVVPYEYQGEDKGPIHPQVFVKAWEAAGKPSMMWELRDFIRTAPVAANWHVHMFSASPASRPQLDGELLTALRPLGAGKWGWSTEPAEDESRAVTDWAWECCNTPA